MWRPSSFVMTGDSDDEGTQASSTGEARSTCRRSGRLRGGRNLKLVQVEERSSLAGYLGAIGTSVDESG